MTDGDVEMPQLGIAETTGGLEKEHMVGAPVIGEPEIPYPRVWQSQHGAPFRREEPCPTRTGPSLPQLPHPVMMPQTSKW
jgi:hypothetical protein